jgi:tetratricopeptide (TPR) repeat protein
MTSEESRPESPPLLAGKRVALVGRLASMAKRDAAMLLRRHGATVAEKPGPTVDLLVIGEEGLPLPEGLGLDDAFDADTQEAIQRGATEVITETELWQRLGLVDLQQDVHRLYTPAMLAELLGVPLAIVRRWHRRGLIVPAREVRRLAYFDFQEVATARRLAELLAAGTSPEAIEKKLETLGRYLPGIKRPLAQLSVIVEGKQILLRRGDGLIEPGGQQRFDFEAAPGRPAVGDGVAFHSRLSVGSLDDVLLTTAEPKETAEGAASPEELVGLAVELEESGQTEAAAEAYRAAMAAGGPRAELCFQVAELLYRLGDLAGARERYYMAIELDEDYVEARANLGCVLAETSQTDLAVAAFAGALAYHPDYADAHYHLARTLDRLDRRAEAAPHWEAFLQLAPDSPWAEEARARLDGAPQHGSVDESG